MTTSEERYDEMMLVPDTTCEFEIVREVVQPGRSFSEEAMGGLIENMNLWVGTRIMRRWEATNEPPTVCKITIKVDVQ